MEFEIGTEYRPVVSSGCAAKIDAHAQHVAPGFKAPVVIKLDLGAIPVISLSVAS